MKKTVIIGGVAAGAGCAARLRRLDENAEIVLLERGPYISYANCGVKAGGFCPELTGTFCPHSAGISVRHPGRSRQWHL